MSKLSKMKSVILSELQDYKLLLRSVPSEVLTLFCMSVVLMNILANKEIGLNLSWIALDCGFSVSWLSFLFMDMLAKRFGPKASFKISVFAVVVNLLVCAVFYIVSLIPGNWGEYYTYSMSEINTALNNTIGGTWYVLLGSTIAFIVSAAVNSVVNGLIAKLINNRFTFKEYALRSYISTMLAQFVDNLVFALLVSHVFFGWSMLQVITCSLTGCVIELVCEIVFSPIGYKVCKKWEAEKVGKAYIDFNGGEK